eukprot:740451-Pyramimonas_sp.AAC.1
MQAIPMAKKCGGNKPGTVGPSCGTGHLPILSARTSNPLARHACKGQAWPRVRRPPLRGAACVACCSIRIISLT